MELPQILCEVAIGTSNLVIDQTKVKTAKETCGLSGKCFSHLLREYVYIVSYIATYIYIYTVH